MLVGIQVNSLAEASDLQAWCSWYSWCSSYVIPHRTCSFCEEAHKPESSMGAKVEARMFLHRNWKHFCHMVQGWQTGLCVIQMQHKSNWKHLRFGISSRVWWQYCWKIFLWGYKWRWIRYLSFAGHPCDRLVNCSQLIWLNLQIKFQLFSLLLFSPKYFFLSQRDHLSLD